MGVLRNMGIGDYFHLTDKHQTLSVSLVDNVLPRNTSTEVFAELERLKNDLSLFAEIRATTYLLVGIEGHGESRDAGSPDRH